MDGSFVGSGPHRARGGRGSGAQQPLTGGWGPQRGRSPCQGSAGVAGSPSSSGRGEGEETLTRWPGRGWASPARGPAARWWVCASESGGHAPAPPACPGVPTPRVLLACLLVSEEWIRFSPCLTCGVTGRAGWLPGREPGICLETDTFLCSVLAHVGCHLLTLPGRAVSPAGTIPGFLPPQGKGHPGPQVPSFRPYLLALLTHQSNWSTLHQCIHILLGKNREQR